MACKPFLIRNLTLLFPHKICFTDFSASIIPGSRIALIGKNGSGKSTLLKLLAEVETSCGKTSHKETFSFPEGTRSGYVPQLQELPSSLSGGEQFNKAFSQALACDPTLLLLDEPTNHLDQPTKAALTRKLQNYRGTLIIVSHDEALLEAVATSVWHIEEGTITLFEGSYTEYRKKRASSKKALEQQLHHLALQKNENHNRLIKEQKRAQKSRSYGHTQKLKNKWSPLVASSKASSAQKFAGKRSRVLKEEKEKVEEALQALSLPEAITPRFFLQAAPQPDALLVSIHDGSVGYTVPLLTKLTFSLKGTERAVLTGPNGSGKSTFLKALCNKDSLMRSGVWHIPHAHECGYLDQHYSQLPQHLTVLESLKEKVPGWEPLQLRKHLHDFLFRKNEEVTALISTLSGGERARLSLALIAALPPKLLILDEPSNNLDQETLYQVIDVLKKYPGALIISTHDQKLIEALSPLTHYEIKGATLSLAS